ncbi:MAG: non-canonical purine pyrophosphatase, rdgB/HAM1 family [Polyangiaceae bacterium]|jgi:non-canonical purine NTP pyrophosphatase (RdgB/HAM1 family)|nr:non-canonical purine pyrophosphatase, rdgB/HAM1 family [Polyangiaceae bacterium]
MPGSWIFVTSNANKWLEAQRILGYAIERVELDLDELQAETVGAIALAKARLAYERLRRPVIVEDAGFELMALGGFPGPYIKFWERLGGLESLCRAADGLGDRRVRAVCALGICSDAGSQVVEGSVDGLLALHPRGHAGFGWDAVFVPKGEGRTFGEMAPEEKDARSHRRRAWELLRDRL